MSGEENDEQRTEEERIDFISRFYPSYLPVIAQIFSYLTAKQLCIISCVCKKWRKACKTDTKARKRKSKYLSKIKKLRKSVGEENWPIQKRTTAAQSVVPLKARAPLNAVINIHQIFNKSSALSCHLSNNINRDIESKIMR